MLLSQKKAREQKKKKGKLQFNARLGNFICLKKESTEISHCASEQLFWIMNISLPAVEILACQVFQILV